MNKNKGQALVEFVIILPILLILLFCFIDFGRVFMLKNELQNMISDAVLLYDNNKTKEDIKAFLDENYDDDYNVDISYDDAYTTIKIGKKIKPITPGLSTILKDVFDVSTHRVIKNE